MMHDTILTTIGNTPMVRIHHAAAPTAVDIFAKLEGYNPSGSIKDRAALYMITQAELRGDLTPAKTILEATSGNMGIALAMVGAVKGYTVTIVMSEAMSRERRALMQAYGAELILTDAAQGTAGAIARAQEMVAAHPDAVWFADQFNNPDNAAAHEQETAREIFADVGQCDVIVLGAGTAGTLAGIARYVAAHAPQTRIVVAVPPGGYGVQGIQNPTEDFRGALWEQLQKYETVSVRVDDAYSAARDVMRTQGISAGMSSGAALVAARHIAATMTRGRIVVIFPDRAEKYVSTALFQFQ